MSGRMNPSGVACMTVKHPLGVLVPGSVATCRPPPVHSCTDLALSYTHLRVRSEPQSRADCANSSQADHACNPRYARSLSLIHISEPTRRTPISYAVFCLKKKK